MVEVYLFQICRVYPVTAYRLGGRVTLEELLEFIPDSNGEQQQLLGLMRKGRLSLAEAKEKYPDWYERRIVKKERRGRWTVKRDLYDYTVLLTRSGSATVSMAL